MVDLTSIRLFLLDMDGTIYHEDELIPGALDFFHLLNARGVKYAFMTNNSSKSKYAYVKKLHKLGINASIDNIASSVNATISYLKRYNSCAKLYVVGTESFKEELLQEGFCIVDDTYRGADVDCVVLGFDTELTYEKIVGACYYVSRGTHYIATNCDLKCPVKDNRYIPDCGAMANLIEYATNRRPLFLGKPDRFIVESVAEQWNIPLDQIACVGDRLYTDIAVGINAGVTSICVLTGEATMAEIEATNIRPDYCFDSIKELYQALL